MTTTTKKAAAKTATKPAAKAPDPEPERPKVDVAACCSAWADARDHIRVIDAQTGPNANLPAGEAARLGVLRAEHVAAQERAEAALAG